MNYKNNKVFFGHSSVIVWFILIFPICSAALAEGSLELGGQCQVASGCDENNRGAATAGSRGACPKSPDNPDGLGFYVDCKGFPGWEYYGEKNRSNNIVNCHPDSIKQAKQGKPMSTGQIEAFCKFILPGMEKEDKELCANPKEWDKGWYDKYGCERFGKTDSSKKGGDDNGAGSSGIGGKIPSPKAGSGNGKGFRVIGGKIVPNPGSKPSITREQVIRWLKDKHRNGGLSDKLKPTSQK